MSEIRGARVCAGLAAAAAVIALLSASQLYFNWTSAGYEARFSALLGAELVEWGLWALSVPVVVAVEARVGFRARALPLALLAHATTAVALFAVSNAVATALTPVVDGATSGASLWSLYQARAAAKAVPALVVYGTILGGYSLLQLRVEREREAAEGQRLRADLASAQLLNLKRQLHPHFLFNTLHLIADLVRNGDRGAAVDTMDELGQLLRQALRDADRQECPVEEELDVLRGYIRIQRLRFGDRLQVETHVDPAAERGFVPSFSLQPLVENAIRHGLSLDEGPGRVRIDVHREDSDLVVRVWDNGCGLARCEPAEGVGLTSVRDRLTHIHGDRAALSLQRAKRGGTEAILRLPFRTRESRSLHRAFG